MERLPAHVASHCRPRREPESPSAAVDRRDRPARVLRLLLVGRQARKLGRRDLARVARWVPMAVADFASEWFESELLRAVVASRAVFGNPAGPWSAGTTATFLQRLAEDPAGRQRRHGASGPGAVSDALAKIATRAGATIRTNARVARITARDGHVTGVVLEAGDEIPARVVASAVDPRQTFLSWPIRPTCRRRSSIASAITARAA